MELDRLYAEFSLFNLRNIAHYGAQTLHPQLILYPCNSWLFHPSKKYKFPFNRLSVSSAQDISKTPALHIYTDGSYTIHAAGAAYIALTGDSRVVAIKRLRIQDATSSYVTELAAFHEALLFASNTTENTTYLHTDCLSLLKKLGNLQDNDEWIWTVKFLLCDIISKGSVIKLFHVPAHVGILGNELADTEASSAVQSGSVCYSKMLIHTVWTRFYKILNSCWHRDWQTQGSESSVFHWISSIYEIPKWFPPHKSLTQLMTGHGHSQYYLKHFNLTTSDTCACGQICNDEQHYFNECTLTKHLLTHFRFPHNHKITREDYPKLLQNKRTRACLLQMVSIMKTSVTMAPPQCHTDAT